MTALKDVKVGDKIACHGSYGVGCEIFTVERVTKTIAFCDRDAAFMVESGRMRGSSGWGSRSGFIPSSVEVDRITLENRIKRANKRLGQIKLTPATIDAAEALIKAAENPEASNAG